MSTPDAVEYGILHPKGHVLDPTASHSEALARLERYRESWPDAILVTRDVRYTPWVPAPSESD